MPKRRGVKKSVKARAVKRTFFERYLTLDWKEAYLLLILWFLCMALHYVYAMVFGFQENVLIIFYKWIIPVFFLIALIYTVHKKRNK